MRTFTREDLERIICGYVMVYTDRAAEIIFRTDGKIQTKKCLEFMSAAKRIIQEGGTPDLVVMTRAQGAFLPGELADMSIEARSESNLDYLLEELDELHAREVLEDRLMRVVTMVRGDEDFDLCVSAVSDAVRDAVSTLAGESIVSAGEAVREALRRQREQILRVPTGVPTLDRAARGGMGPGQLWILAARPSMGKSAWALKVGLHAARHGHPVVFISLEMSISEIGERIIALETKVPVSEIKTFVSEDYEPEDVPLFIDESSSLTPEALVSKIHTYVARLGVKLVIIDYLQLLRLSVRRGEHRANVLGRATKLLKATARDLGISILVLSQLNRGVEARTPPRPTLRDLRDSGEIEEDADVALLLWRPEWYGYNDMNPELIVAKHRQGSTPIVNMMWIPERMEWQELDLNLKTF